MIEIPSILNRGIYFANHIYGLKTKIRSPKGEWEWQLSSDSSASMGGGALNKYRNAQYIHLKLMQFSRTG